MSFVAVGAFTLVLGILVWSFVRDRPEDKGWPSPREAQNFEKVPAIGLAEGIKMVISNAAFWPLAIWFFFDCAVFFSFGGLWGGLT